MFREPENKKKNYIYNLTVSDNINKNSFHKYLLFFISQAYDSAAAF